MAQDPNTVKTATPEVPVREFKFAYRYLLLDLFLRWAVFGLRQAGFINEWIFWLIQTIAVSFIVLYFADRRTTQVAEKYSLPYSKAQTKDTPASVLFALSALALGVYVSYSLYRTPAFLRIVLGFVAFGCYGFYVTLVYILSIDWTPANPEPAASPEDLTDHQWRDQNDRAIIELETDKNSLSSKVDAYTLESALFGALAFSAFVTIVASEKPVLQGVQRLVGDSVSLFRMMLGFNFGTINDLLNDLTSEQTLLAAIATQTLISAVFFLTVIISRLRFNDVMRRVELTTQLAITYNNKEEEVSKMYYETVDKNLLSRCESRLSELKTMISQATYYAEESMKDLVPIVRYMSVARHLGVLSFLLILITSALWVSRLLAIVFAAISLFVFIYPSLDRLIRDRKLISVDFLNRGKRFFPHLRNK